MGRPKKEDKTNIVKVNRVINTLCDCCGISNPSAKMVYGMCLCPNCYKEIYTKNIVVITLLKGILDKLNSNDRISHMEV